MRILLISANTETEPYPVYPLGMALVAAALRDRGHEVRQADRLRMRNGESAPLHEEIRAFAPQVAGISLRNIDNVDSFTAEEHWHLENLRLLVMELRALTQSPIVLGGPGYSLLPEAILEYCGADYGISGAGEEAFCALLDILETGGKPPRITSARGGEKQPAPLYDLPLLEYYARESGVVNLQTKRGCSKHCLYCTYPALEGHAVRAREPKAVVEDIVRLRRTVAFKELFFTDAVFNDEAGQWLSLIEAMAGAGINVPWTAFFQPENLDRETLGLCMRTGLKAVEFGTDATCDETLHGLNKGFSFASVLACDALCNELALPCAHFVIFGGPGENSMTLREGLANLDKLGNSLVFAFLGIRIYAGSALMALAAREGCIDGNDSTLRPSYYFSPELDRERTVAELSANFRKKRLRVFPPSRGQARMEALRRLGFRGILWDQMIRRSA